MAWSGKVNPAGGQKLLVFDADYPSLASAAVSGIPLLEWPFEFKGRVVSIAQGADAISAAGSILTRYRRFDSSGPTTAFMVGAGKAWPADDFTRIDSDDADTVAAEELLELGDRILLDKDAGGSITRGRVIVVVAVG